MHLTTSSYAVLSLLAIRPWSAYELIQQATRSLRFAWPKSERLLYSEPKKLVAAGLATSRTETNGAKSRAVYEITDEGRHELERWMTRPPEAAQLEAEALVRVLFADYGTLDDLRASLAKFRDDAGDLEDQVRALMAGYLDGQHPFPHRMHLSVLFATFQLELFDLIARWTKFAEREIIDWPTTEGLGMTEGTRALLERIAHNKRLVPSRTQRTGRRTDLAC